MILLVILLIGLIILSFKNKVYGLGSYFLIRLCIPDTCRLGSLSFNTISLAIYVCILLVFYHGKINPNRTILNKFQKQVLFLFGGIILLSFFALIVPLSYQYKYLLQFFITEFVPSLCILLVIGTEKEFKTLIKFIAAGAIFNCLYGIMTFFVDSNPIYDNLTSVSANELAMYDREEGRFGFARKAEGIYGKFNGKIMMTLISLLIFTFFYNKKYLPSKTRYILLFSAFVVNILTSQRSGLFGIFAFIILLADKKQIYGFLKKYGLLLGVCVILIMMIPELKGFRDLFSSVFYMFDDKMQDKLGTSGSSVEMRISQFEMVWSMISTGILSGLGYAFDQYRGEFFKYDNEVLRGLESFFLKVLINTGILGVALWIRFLLELVKPAYRIREMLKNKYYFAYLTAYLVAILFTDISGSFFLFLAFATLNLLEMQFKGYYNGKQQKKLIR